MNQVVFKIIQKNEVSTGRECEVVDIFVDEKPLA